MDHIKSTAMRALVSQTAPFHTFSDVPFFHSVLHRRSISCRFTAKARPASGVHMPLVASNKNVSSFSLQEIEHDRADYTCKHGDIESCSRQRVSISVKDHSVIQY